MSFNGFRPAPSPIATIFCAKVTASSIFFINAPVPVVTSNIVNNTGLSVIGQSGEIAPADKKLYALRDVTATVDSIPLIAASIMSKKLAAGSDKIVLDVTTGTGAFMKNIDDAITLAQKMVVIGEGAGRNTVAYITNMDVPLGIATGNNIDPALHPRHFSQFVKCRIIFYCLVCH